MGFQTSSALEFREAMSKQARLIQLVLGGLGAISLFVAALGITNTMIMSIYERTREIGVMKVLGCRLNDIRMMFLLEAGRHWFSRRCCRNSFQLLPIFYSESCDLSFGGRDEYEDFCDSILVGAPGHGVCHWRWPDRRFSPANRAVKISPLAAIRQE